MTAASKDITLVPLTSAEETLLARLEDVVVTGMATFVEVGRALAAIRNGKLYRQTHPTFAAYVSDRFGLSESSAYRQMDAAEVVAILSPIGEVANEAQARELAGLEPQHVQEVFSRAVTSSRETGEALTAAALRKARQDVIPRPSRPARRRALPEQYRRLVDDLDTASRKLAALHRDDRFGDNRASLTFKAVLLAEIAERLAALAGEIGPQPALPSPTLYASISDSNDNVVGSPPASGEVTATMSARRSPRGAMVHLYVKGGSTVVAGRGQAVTAVRSALERLGVTSMRSPHPPRKLTFPAARVDDVQALLEADGHAVELVRWSQ